MFQGGNYVIDTITDTTGTVHPTQVHLQRLYFPDEFNGQYNVAYTTQTREGVPISISISDPGNWYIPSWFENTGGKLLIDTTTNLNDGVYNCPTVNGRKIVNFASGVLTLNNATIVNAEKANVTQTITNASGLAQDENGYYVNCLDSNSTNRVSFEENFYLNGKLKVSGLHIGGYIENADVYIESMNPKPYISLLLNHCKIWFKTDEFNEQQSQLSVKDSSFMRRIELTKNLTDRFDGNITFKEGFHANASTFDFSKLQTSQSGYGSFTFSILGPVGTY